MGADRREAECRNADRRGPIVKAISPRYYRITGIGDISNLKLFVARNDLCIRP